MKFMLKVRQVFLGHNQRCEGEILIPVFGFINEDVEHSDHPSNRFSCSVPARFQLGNNRDNLRQPGARETKRKPR